MSAADIRFQIDRITGLCRRGLASLRTRGLRASWERVLKQFQRVPRQQRPELFLPEAGPFAPFTLPCSDQPRASIVIPVYNQFAHTLACLRAIAAHPPATACEVIVVDDGSTDDTEAALRQVEGLLYHRRAENGGFIAACNDGAAIAGGEYLVFLNNDTVPQPGWLDALVDTFDVHPGTGIVGGQLLYPDGRLQEAGGIVFSDGSGWNLGRFESPFAPRYAHLRPADYCSGAALATPRAHFLALGGFDTRYAPAYYEDTDFAFATRAKGLAVIYQPAARIVHDEGTTSGTDTTSGVKAHQVRNQPVFVEKWRAQLAAQHPAGTPAERAHLPPRMPQVLVIDALTPHPDHDSGSLRLLNLMRLLREEGAHPVFLPADLRHDGVHTLRLQAAGIEAWHAPFARSVPAWLREHGPRFDTVIVCRHYVMREMLPLLRLHAPRARVVFDTVDLHYLRERRGAELAGDSALARAAERTRRLELELVHRSDATLVVSAVERELLAVDAPGARVDILSNLHHLPEQGPAFAERRDVMFVGGFRHPPNVDAVLWFTAEVWPLLRARAPALRFHCIGGDVPASIRRLHGHEGIEVHGHVPDLEPWLEGARVAVAPLRYGAGVKGKINQSMAHGQPVVATHCAVEGMHLVDGHDVLVADTPLAFAEAVLRAHGDEHLWRQLAENARQNVERHFSLDAGRDVVRRVLLRGDEPTQRP
ncbi:glycosyltransferase [Marilutibacter aestuarii]